jgi:hypothetical protein
MMSFLLDGLAILRIASTFAGVASMPRCPTMKPKSSPEGTQKTHFVGLSFHWNSHRLVKVSMRSAMSLSSSMVLTTTSST